MLIDRTIASSAISLSRQYSAVTIMGPRQSGKTTLCKQLFPEKEYLSLEEIDNREFAKEDLKGFLEEHPKGLVIDEIQRVSGLISYIQTDVDASRIKGKYIIT